MRKRIIVRSKTQLFPVERKPKGRQRLSERQKWKNRLGKSGMFQWDVRIIEKGQAREQVISTDSYDDAKAWAYFKCKEGMTIFIDGMEIITK